MTSQANIIEVWLITYQTERGKKWRLMKGNQVVWSKPAEGSRAITHSQALTEARKTLLDRGFDRLVDRTTEILP